MYQVLLFVIPGVPVSSAVICNSRCTGIKCCYFVIPSVQVSSAVICYSRCTGIKCYYH